MEQKERRVIGGKKWNDAIEVASWLSEKRRSRKKETVKQNGEKEKQHGESATTFSQVQAMSSKGRRARGVIW